MHFTLLAFFVFASQISAVSVLEQAVLDVSNQSGGAKHSSTNVSSIGAAVVSADGRITMALRSLVTAKNDNVMGMEERQREGWTYTQNLDCSIFPVYKPGILKLSNLAEVILVDPAGSAFDGRAKYEAGGLSGVIYKQMKIGGVQMYGQMHEFGQLRAGQAVWNPSVEGVVGVIHAVGPNYQGRYVDRAYWDTLEKTFKSINAILALKEYTFKSIKVALPLISSGIFKPRDLDIKEYMGKYIEMIEKYLRDYTVYLNLFTNEEKDAFRSLCPAAKDDAMGRTGARVRTGARARLAKGARLATRLGAAARRATGRLAKRKRRRKRRARSTRRARTPTARDYEVMASLLPNFRPESRRVVSAAVPAEAPQLPPAFKTPHPVTGSWGAGVVVRGVWACTVTRNGGVQLRDDNNVLAKENYLPSGTSVNVYRVRKADHGYKQYKIGTTDDVWNETGTKVGTTDGIVGWTYARNLRCVSL